MCWSGRHTLPLMKTHNRSIYFSVQPRDVDEMFHQLCCPSVCQKPTRIRESFLKSTERGSTSCSITPSTQTPTDQPIDKQPYGALEPTDGTNPKPKKTACKPSTGSRPQLRNPVKPASEGPAGTAVLFMCLSNHQTPFPR